MNEKKTEEQTQVKKHRLPISRGAAYGLAIAYVSSLLIAAVAFWYANYVNDQNNRKWCHVLIAVDDAYATARDNPNVSATGKRIAEEFHKQRVDFGC